MILEQLRLRRFGRFRDDAWEFAPGLNVVRGPNEAGKSTMREAIVRLLLADRNVSTSDRSFLALQRWGEVEGFVIEGTLLTDDGRFHLVRDYEESRAELRCDSTGQAMRDEALINERLYELLGVHSRAIYETTACLAQQEFAQLEAGREVSTLLQQTVTGPGSESGAQAVLDALASEVSSLRRGIDRHAKNPGPVRAARDRIAELEEQIAHLSPIVSGAEEARDRIDRLSERLAEIDAELGQANRLRERAEQRRKIEGELASVRERCNELEQRERQAGRLSEEVAEVEERLEALPEIEDQQVEDLRELHRACEQAEERAPQLREEAQQRTGEAERADERVTELEGRAPDAGTVQEARDRAREMDGLKANLAGAEQDAARAEEELQASRRATGGRMGWLAAAAVLVLAGAGLALGLGEAWPWTIAGAGVVLAIIGAMRGPRIAVDVAEERARETAGKVADTRTKMEGLQEQLDDLLRETGAEDVEALSGRESEARQALDEAREERTRAATRAQTAREEADRAEQHVEITRARLDGRLRQLEAESVEQFTQTAREVFELRGRLSDARSKLRGVLSDRALPEIREELSDLSSRRRGLEQQLESDEMAYAELTPERFDELVTQIGSLSDERERITDEIDRHRGAASHPEADPERLRQWEEQLEVTRERLQRHEERLAATELARELLDQAHRETLSAAIDVLEPRTSELLSAITAGRYTQVGFDRANLAPSVHSEEKGEVIEVGADTPLSCATREQVYLAARLALTDLLWPDGPPPIMLDDPFVNFDPWRRRQALEIVRGLAADSQVILFTCDDLYDEVADRVIELPGPTAR